MATNRIPPSPRGRERGAILAFTGMALLTLVGMTVVGVDLARLAFTATEVQTVAEVAATAYAREWINQNQQGLTGACTGNPVDPCGTAALQVIDGNRINGQQATNTNIASYELGAYDFASFGPFRPGATSTGGQDVPAVRANATATVNNFFAAMVGAPTSVVTKSAVATLTCRSDEAPIPLAVGDCAFGGFDGPEDCEDLPLLSQQNVHLDNSCWTNLGNGPSGVPASTIRNWIHAACGLSDGPNPPTVSVGDTVDVNTGGKVPGCTALQDCWDAGLKTFIVPVIPCVGGVVACESSAQRTTISGFAKIELSSRPICSPSEGTCMCAGNVPCPPAENKCVQLHAICASNPGGGGGGNCSFGLMSVAMVE